MCGILCYTFGTVPTVLLFFAALKKRRLNKYSALEADLIFYVRMVGLIRQNVYFKMVVVFTYFLRQTQRYFYFIIS